MNQRMLAVPAGAALLVSLALVGCNRPADEAQRAETQPTAPTSMEQKVDQAQASAQQQYEPAKDAAADMATDAKVAGKNAADEVGSKVSDAVITTSVNAELAKDAKLSALKINVDTSSGRVALRGTAPDATSRERATQLAMAVKGVVSVDNQLTIDPPKS